MTTNRVRRRGSYAPLSARYYTDDAIMAVGEKAELLYIRGLAFCADALRDGFISDRQVLKVIGGGMRDAQARADRLVAADLWIRDDERGGYMVKSWLSWNLPAETIRAKMDADAARKGGRKS